MKNSKKFGIIIISCIIVIFGAGFLYNYLKDPKRLTINEKNWINENIKNVSNINVLNNDNIFGINGNGVFYDFLEEFSEEYLLNINPVTYNMGESVSGLYLGKGNEVSAIDTIFYKDHYVLLSKKYNLIKDVKDLNGKTVGVLTDNLAYLTSYLQEYQINYDSYNLDELSKALTEGKEEYIIVPLTENYDFILNNDLHVLYHFGDINYYYFLKNDESTFASVLAKYFLSYQEELEEDYNEFLFNLFCSDLKISGTDISKMQNKEYNYGFVNDSPYEVIIGGNYGGIAAVYLQKFHEFSDIEFNFTRFKNYSKFIKSLEQGKTDIYFNHYSANISFQDAKMSMPISYDVILSNTDNTVVTSLNSLQGKEVYIEENSMLLSLLNDTNIKFKTYKNVDELFKLCRNDIIAIVDHNTFDYYKANKLAKYSSRYNDVVSGEYYFKVNDNGAFYKVFSKYIELLDSKEVVTEGILNHFETVKKGTIISKIAQYILYLILIAAVILLYVYKKTKKISISKKIKKEDKLLFIDQLTSLKNRNYLNENIDAWNNNNVYPQAVIVVDLNNIAKINDTLGYGEGDKQIKALANALIKTQLDYTDIIRTDGNEFLIYMIGYTQKQVVSYIHKLNKEFKKLPYDYGAEFGYSMIVDDLKSIEDAINEAFEEMKKQKKEKSNNE